VQAKYSSRSAVGREAVTLLMLMVEKRKLPFNEHAARSCLTFSA
jgi:hypothetical protein